jgi:hypothetical protein
MATENEPELQEGEVPTTELETELDPVIPDKEPGGDKPENAYQRQLYRDRKRLQDELAVEKAERIRAEERAKTLEEVRRDKKAEEPVYSMAQIEKAVEKGSITREEAAVYIENVLWPKKLSDEFTKREQKVLQEAPLEKARKDIDKYMQLVPELSDKNSVEYRKVSDKVRELIGYGHPAGPQTDRIAAEMVLGGLDKVKKRQELGDGNSSSRTMPIDNGSGTPPKPSGKVDLSKAPESLQRVWQRNNITDTNAQARQLKIYNERHAERQTRFK